MFAGGKIMTVIRFPAFHYVHSFCLACRSVSVKMKTLGGLGCRLLIVTRVCPAHACDFITNEYGKMDEMISAQGKN